jgi:hypothetical protein
MVWNNTASSNAAIDNLKILPFFLYQEVPASVCNGSFLRIEMLQTDASDTGAGVLSLSQESRAAANAIAALVAALEWNSEFPNSSSPMSAH